MACQAAAFLMAQDRVRDDPQDLDEAREAAALFRRCEPRLLRVGVFEKPRQVIGRLLDAGGQALGPFDAQDVVRVSSRRQADDAGGKAFREEMGQGPARRRAAGGIAVVADDDGGREAPELARLFRSERRAHGSDGLFDSRGDERQVVEVALDDDGAVVLSHRVAGVGEAVEEPLLLKDGRLGRVQVLRFALRR